ncbi:hypothetical protein VB776_06830 [Arcicella sp. DC2W]|uniref:Uncharacterized protein n=1 Tax=Arcicella gelida TaxID=2984195 RepID=A0ABU5S2E0_9BACT|nr:hypothetical protein [Arcicella sp. DC2W]MEA5402621.1 hypothetical protein [Arcicella sp. DC2W]
MHLLFEHYKNIDNYFKQRIMLLGVKGDWVHCEIIFDELDNLRASSWGSKGTDFEKWENIKKPNLFEIYMLPSENWREVYQFMKNHEGTPYDKLGVIGMVYGIAVQHKNSKFCSEICYEAIKNHVSLPIPSVRPSSVSPLQLRRWIINSGVKRVPSLALNK